MYFFSFKLEAGADPNITINITGQAKVSPLILAAQ